VQSPARVDLARWQEAQRYERRTWMEKNLASATDRNEYHRRMFGGYAALAGRRFDRAIELGCGPFTNMRMILPSCAIGELTLLDPLITDYLLHPYCQYKNGRLGGIFNVRPHAKNPLILAALLYKNFSLGGFFGRPVQIISGMIEQYDLDQTFDLVVMVNVLEHCQDVQVVFDKIEAMLKPGGYFVFHDRLLDNETVKTLSERLYDSGHPLRIQDAVIEEFLSSNFSPLFMEKRSVSRDFRGIHWKEIELYFIGVFGSPPI